MVDETLIVESVPDPEDELEVIRSELGPEYEIMEELGRGGMAVVYRAREHALERDVAIKVLPLAKTFDSELVERFQREARMAASLEHAHIIPIYRVGQSGRVSFFVMKYVKGASLADRLEAGERLEPGEVERILLEVGEALDYAHRHGVIHRDVKPDNIMQDATGRYVVMDFGIAKSVGSERLTQLGGSIGTPKYMSPEQGRGVGLDGRSDFYSLGVVAYHCFTGRPPFEGDDPLAVLYAHQHDPVPEPALGSEEQRRVYGVIRRLLAKDPQDRLQSGTEVRAALGEAAAPAESTVRGTTSVGARVVPGDVVAWLRGRTRRFWVTAGVGAALLFVLTRDGAVAECRAALRDASEDDREVLVEPLGTIRSGASIEVAFVVCGAPKDMPFQARIMVRPSNGGGVVGGVRRIFGGNRSPVRVSWDDVSDGFATSRSRDVEPGELEAGSYRLTVTVQDQSGSEAEASHDFTVVEDGA